MGIPWDTIRYDTRCYFNVRPKADMSQLNLPHGNGNKTPTWKWEWKGVRINVDGNGNGPYFHGEKIPTDFFLLL